MPAKVLITDQLTTDEAVDTALLILPPLHDNVLLVVRNLQHQITDLTARVTALET